METTRIGDAPVIAPTRSREHHNVGDRERVVSVVSGGALALYGLRRRDLPGLSLALIGAELVRRGATGHCRVYRALGMSTLRDEEAFPPRAPGEIVGAAATVNARQSIKIRESVTIHRPRTEVYAVWRDIAGLPAYIPELESVTVRDSAHSHWVVNVPGEKRVEWDSQIVNDVPNEIIAWKTIGDPDVAHAGSVNFRDADAGRGTEMRIEIDYEPPGGKLLLLVAALMRRFGQAPASKVQDDLRRFKAQLETGSPPTTTDQSRGA